MKRLFDFGCALLGLLLLWPLFVAIGLLIRRDSRGPIFYRQKRVGRYGLDFWLVKFRTMYPDADRRGLLLTTDHRDPRITRAGYFLRRYKLDELPQLWNVLLGEMSLVGPRPEVRKYVELYTAEQCEVLRLRPGITDLASIKYAAESELLSAQADPENYYIQVIMPDKLRINLAARAEIEQVSGSLRIIWMTLMRVVRPDEGLQIHLEPHYHERPPSLPFSPTPEQ